MFVLTLLRDTDPVACRHQRGNTEMASYTHGQRGIFGANWIICPPLMFPAFYGAGKPGEDALLRPKSTGPLQRLTSRMAGNVI